MSARGWRGERSLEESLFNEPHTFDFLQAVHLLELRSQAPSSPHDLASSPVRFRPTFELSFSSSEIRDLRQASPSSPAEMTTSFFGPGGIDGPLPTSFSEEILGRLHHQDSAVTAFLEIFHNRLLWLFYRIHKTASAALATTTPDRTPSGRYLFSLIGLGLEPLAAQMRAPATLLRYAGLFAGQQRSAEGLRVLLADYFGVPVEVKQFVGDWYALEPDQLTRVGAKGANNALGSAVIGTRVWIQDAGIGLRIGPLTASEFEAFLPGGTSHDALAEVATFYAGKSVRIGVELVLRGQEDASATLGTSRIGWSAWLRTSPLRAPDDQVRLRLGSSTPAPEGP